MRIRSIKPEFWRSEDISSLDIPDRLLFIGLWSYVDDNGVGQDRESLVAADLFADDLSRDPRETLARVSGGLERLSEAGRIVRYTVDGRAYLAVTNWERHQRIDKPNKPRYPLPTSENAVLTDTLATPSRDTRDTLATPSRLEQGNRGTGEQGSNTLGHPAGDRERIDPSGAHDERDDEHDASGTQSEDAPPQAASAYPPVFEQWWGEYPKKVGKRRALKDWKQAVKREPAGEIIAATRRFAEYHAACGTEKRFIPNPSTWLNRDGWGDELPQVRQIQAPAGPQTGARRTDEQVLRALLSTPQNGPQDVIDGEIIQQRQIG